MFSQTNFTLQNIDHNIYRSQVLMAAAKLARYGKDDFNTIYHKLEELQKRMMFDTAVELLEKWYRDGETV